MERFHSIAMLLSHLFTEIRSVSAFSARLNPAVFPYTEHNGWFYNCENKSLIGSLSHFGTQRTSSSKYHLRSRRPSRSQSDSNRSLPSAFNRPLYIQSVCYMRDNNNRERKEQSPAERVIHSHFSLFLFLVPTGRTAQRHKELS